MKTKLKKAVLYLLCLSFVLSFAGGMNAEAATKRKEATKSFFFTTPRGQTAAVNVFATITETYTKGTTKNKFTKRDCFLAYSAAYSGSKPKVTRTAGVHRSIKTGEVKKNFKKWTKGTYLWDVAKYPYGSGSYNSTSVSYKKSTDRKSGFSYSVYCADSLIPTQTGSVYVSLKTK